MSNEEKSKKGLKSFLVGILVTIKAAAIWLISIICSPKAEKMVEVAQEGLNIVKGAQKKGKSGELQKELDKGIETAKKLIDNV